MFVYDLIGKDGALEMANLLIKLNQCDMAIKVLNPLPLEVKVIPMANVCFLVTNVIYLQYVNYSLKNTSLKFYIHYAI